MCSPRPVSCSHQPDQNPGRHTQDQWVLGRALPGPSLAVAQPTDWTSVRFCLTNPKSKTQRDEKLNCISEQSSVLCRGIKSIRHTKRKNYDVWYPVKMTRHRRRKIRLIMRRKTRLKITLKRHMLELKGHFMMRKG